VQRPVALAGLPALYEVQVEGAGQPLDGSLIAGGCRRGPRPHGASAMLLDARGHRERDDVFESWDWASWLMSADAGERQDESLAHSHL